MLDHRSAALGLAALLLVACAQAEPREGVGGDAADAAGGSDTRDLGGGVDPSAEPDGSAADLGGDPGGGDLDGGLQPDGDPGGELDVDTTPDLSADTSTDDSGDGDTGVTDAGPDVPDVVADTGQDVGQDIGLDAGADAAEDTAADTTADTASEPDEGSGDCEPLPTSGTLPLLGDNTPPPSWHRPFSDCTGYSALATDVGYGLHVLCNTGASANFDLYVDGEDEDASLTNADPFVHIYAGDGYPADPLDCLAADDDGQNVVGGSLVSDLSVAAGARITVIVSSFDLGEEGTYQLRIVRLP